MRYIIRVLFFAMLCAPALAQTSWVTLHDPAGAFSVDFPVAPTISNDSTKDASGDTIPIVTYLYDPSSNIALLIMVGDFSAVTLDVQKTMDGAVASVQEDRTLVSNSVDVRDGQTGRYIVATDKDGNLVSDRVYLVNGRMYQAIVMLGPKATPDDKAAADHFNASLHFP